MSVSYVCAACRNSRLLSPRIFALRRGRQFSNSIRRHNESGFESPYAEWGSRSQSEYDDEEYTANVFGEQPIRPSPEPRSGRYSRSPLRPAQLLDELNHSLQHQAPAAEPQTSERHQQSEARRRRPIKEKVPHSDTTRRLREKADLFATLVEEQRWTVAWDCLKEIRSLCSGLDRQVLSVIRRGRYAVVQNLFRMHCVDLWATTLQQKAPFPLPSEMLQLMHDIGWYSRSSCPGVLWGVSSALHSYRVTHSDDDPRLRAGISELIGVWQVCLEQKTHQSEFVDTRGDTSGDDTARDMPWSLLPSPEALGRLSREVHGESSLQKILWSVLPGPKLNDDGTMPDLDDGSMTIFDYASPALATLDLLRAPLVSARSNVTSFPQYKPFLDFLEEAVRLTSPVTVPPRLRNKLDPNKAGAHFFLPMVRRLELPVDPELVAQIQDARDYHQGQSSEYGREDAGTPGVFADDNAELASAEEIVFGVQQTPEMHNFAKSCIVRLIRARNQNNFHLAQMVKHEVLEMAERNANDGRPPLPIELYEHLMLNFMLLAHPKTAMAVWETMLQSGFSPTVKTYTVMVRGARACRDVNGMKAFWERMRNAGIQPDLPAWTAFIHGLIKLRNLDKGLEAVQEMGREWLAAAQEQASLDRRAAGGSDLYSPPASKGSLLAKYPASVRGVPRPDVTILNCAITALADVRDHAVPEVISWAQTFAIEPDLITYNTLLNLAMRKKQTKSAAALLARMRDRGIAPNADTWVVLLTSMFQNGFLDEVDRDKQLDKVLTWVDGTKTANGKTTVDGKAFALIINRFVKQLKNPDAATGVLAYMAKNNIEFSVHMATIVMTSYFEEDPPNFQAINDLYQRLLNGDLTGGGSLRSSGRTGFIDTVFYDRLIEGYARHHSVIGLKPCLDILNRCQREGRKNGWRALEQVARVMAAKDRFDLLTDLVIGIRARLKQGRGGTQMQGQYDFWNFVISTGILREEGIRRPEDLLPRNGPRPSPLLDGLASEVEDVY